MRTKTLIEILTDLVRVKVPTFDAHKFAQTYSSYSKLIDDKISHEGKKQACMFFKNMHVVAVSIATQDTVPSLPFCKVYQGKPVALKRVLWLLESDLPELKRLGLTITRSYERIKIKPAYDFATITDKGPVLCPKFLKGFDAFCKQWTKSNRINSFRLANHDTEIRSGYQVGPNGPALATAHFDARGLSRQSGLSKNLMVLSRLLGDSSIYNMLEQHQIAMKDSEQSYLSGRITLFPQGGGKTRMIAIGDFFSQNILRPLHRKLLRILESLESDATDQDRGFERILEKATAESYSYDLTAATDRFPIKIQEILLSHIFGEEIALLWRKVLTDRSFHHDKVEYRWGVGQPLGLLSSWTAFSLTHHVLIQYIASKKGIKSFTDYAVLGDDVVIWNTDVAIAYKTTMRDIGVSINMSKSLIGDKFHRRIEFSKRIIFQDYEITGLRPSLLRSSAKSIYAMPSLVRWTKTRHWDLSWTGIENLPLASMKGKEFLAILLFEQEGLMPAFAVTLDAFRTTTPPDIDTLRKYVLMERVASLSKKQSTLRSKVETVRPIEHSLEKSDNIYLQWFESRGISVPARLLGSRGHMSYSHPLRLAFEKYARDLYEATSKLEEFLESWTPLGEQPEELPIEYLPVLSGEALFGDHDDLKTRYHSSIVIKAWTRMKRERSLESRNPTEQAGSGVKLSD